jgi:hypothetical protein
MPVFTLTDINFNQPKGPTGPLSVLGINTKFDSSTYKYPIDLGSTDKNHYMIINILEQRKTTFENPGSGTSGNATIVNNNAAYGSVGSNTLLNNVAGLVNSARAGVGALLNAVGVSDTTFSTAINKVVTPILGSDAANATSQAISNGIQQSFNDLKNGSVRATTRISETIALYMPDTLNFDHSQVYNKASAGGGLLAGVVSAGTSLVDTINGEGSSSDKTKKAIQNISPFIQGAIASQLGEFGKIAFQASTGLAENPMMEMLYGSPDFRTFRFDFNFYPRSEQEAKQVLDIISCLRFHQAPEANKDYGNFYLVPPSEFDISFYYNGKVNPNIPQISTCVLEQINVNYAPNGFSTYEIPGNDAKQGGTGMPVSITLSLQFRETEIMTKQAFNNQDVISGNKARKTKSVTPISLPKRSNADYQDSIASDNQG